MARTAFQSNLERDKPVSRYSNTEQQIPLIDSSQLFGKEKEIMIRHEGAIYRLRITRNGKLIMNK